MKDSTLLLFFTSSGSASHTVGAAYVNALLPKVFVFVFGTFNIDLLEDLSCLGLLYGTRRSAGYCGADIDSIRKSIDKFRWHETLGGIASPNLKVVKLNEALLNIFFKFHT